MNAGLDRLDFEVCFFNSYKRRVILLALKYVPDFFAGVLIKTFDHRNQLALEKVKASLARDNALEAERLKGEISATYATMKSSVDFASTSHRELREKTIGAIDT